MEARAAAEIAGLASNFTDTGKVSGARGPAQKDYNLTRYACYMVAMSCDGRKPEVAAAKTYFAVKTRQAETTPAFDPASLTRRDILEMALDAEKRAQELEAHNKELEPKAGSWEALAAPGGDFSITEAAKVLSRTEGIEIGRNRLFAYMANLGWIYRTQGKRAHWEAYQDKGIKTGRLTHKMGARFINEQTGEWEQAHPTVRVTAKGIHELRLHLTTHKEVVHA